ncbi:unnamed protein product [Rotaria magnacalcarata]|uniref:Uncharacterized protein n=2 Tax=Rotaria magnacalcarata TaxID=392030 RepID=A0A820JYR1_9BILA|nr:unnamed protein product [Rotaria magnacalcarata]CAF4614376.1 unnamed protein product [Rotaria magnacalcarata]
MGPKSRRQRHAITTSTRYLLNRSGNNAEDDAEREEMEVDDIEYEQQPMNFTDRITSDNIADLFELCKYKCPVKTVRTNLPAAGVQGGLQEPFHRDRRRQRQDTYCQVTHRLRLQQGHWHEVPSRQDRLHRLQGKSKSSALQVSGRRAQRQDEGAN